jgi:predicted nucleotidyltransferase
MADSLIEGIIKARHENEMEYDKALKERIKKAYLEIDILLEKFKKLDPQLKKVILFGSLAENKENRTLNSR